MILELLVVKKIAEDEKENRIKKVKVEMKITKTKITRKREDKRKRIK